MSPGTTAPPPPRESEPLRLCDFVRASRPRILDAWQRAIEGQMEVRDLSPRRLIDHLPELLDRIAEMTDLQREAGEESLEELPEFHALERLDLGYPLLDVAAEYAVLRQCILRLYREEVSPTVDARQVERLNEAFDVVIARSLRHYSRARERTVVALERLEQAAHAAEDVEAVLPGVLRVLVETTESVDTAIVLLREGERLVVGATAGLEEELERDFSLAIGEGFAGRIASTAAPLELRNASQDPLVKSPVFRRRGVRALYGVPMVLEGRVVGVTHIGSLTAHEFSAEDKLLFRTMVSRLTGLLARARLQAQERHARREAERARTLLDSFLASVPVGIAWFDRELRYRLVNETLAGYYALTPAGFVGRSVTEIVPEELREPVAARLRRVLETGEPSVGEEYLANFPVGRRWVVSSAFPTREREEVTGVAAVVWDRTSERHTAAALREEMALRDSLLAAQSDVGEGVFIARNREVLYVNDAFCRISGYSAAQVRGLSDVGDLLAPGERTRVSALVEAGAGSAVQQETMLVHRDGHLVDVEVSVKVLPERRWIILCRDISERKAQERERERLLAAVEHADPVFMLDADFRFVFVNAAQERHSMTTRTQSLGRVIWDVFPALKKPGSGYWIEFHRAMQERAPRRFVEHYEPNDVWTDVTVYPTAEGGIAVFFRDVTEQKRAEESLRRAEAEFRTLAETMPQIAWTAGPDGLMDYFNPLLEELTGLPLREALGHGWAQVIRPDDLPRVLEVWSEAVRTGEHRDTEHRVRMRDGSWRWFLSRTRALKDGEGRLVRLFGTTTDIDELKRAQGELQSRARFSEQLVGIVSHDLRNPISAVRMSATVLLRREDLDERQRSALLRILSATDRATRLIRDLLDFTQARLGSGIPLTRTPIDLHVLVGQIVDEVQLAHPERRIALERDGDARGEFDPDRLAQVFTNLIVNAAKHGRGSRVLVRTRVEESQIVFSVSNAGTIPPELLPHIFEPLRQGGRESRGEGGVGLGLYIVEQIVRAHGGRVSVSSTEPEGTTFEVRLPMR